jgi:large subunit ribosomal protein L30
VASLSIKLVKSLAGRQKNQIKTAKALGLRKIGKTTVQPDNPSTRGKIFKLKHMVEVLNINQS